MAIEQRVNGAFRWNFNSRKSPDQALSNLARAPTGVLALHVQDVGSPPGKEADGHSDKGGGFGRLGLVHRIPDSDRKSYSRSCGRCRTLCRVPPSARQLAGERQTALSSMTEHSFQGIASSPKR